MELLSFCPNKCAFFLFSSNCVSINIAGNVSVVFMCSLINGSLGFSQTRPIPTKTVSVVPTLVSITNEHMKYQEKKVHYAPFSLFFFL